MQKLRESFFSVVKKIFFMIGILFLLYGVIVLCILGPYRVFNFFYLAAGSFLILLTRAWDHLNVRTAKVLSLTLLILGIIFIITEVIIISYSLKPAEKDADYVIVLGSQIRDDGPSLDYKARLDSAYDYYRNNPDTFIICTGAKGPSEPVSEAKGGAEYLIRSGIPKEKILIEDQSRNTFQNLENAAKLIEKQVGDPAGSDIVIVSASYHLYRAHILAEKIGFRQISCQGGHGLRILQPHYYTREFFALIKEMISNH